MAAGLFWSPVVIWALGLEELDDPPPEGIIFLSRSFLLSLLMATLPSLLKKI